VNKKLLNSSILREQIERMRVWASRNTEKEQKTTSEAQKEEKHSNQEIFTEIISFAVDQQSYYLRDTWILDSGANCHVYNDPSRFKFERPASENDTLKAGKSVHPIKAFGSVNISVLTSTGSKQITLLNVALVPGFFTNMTSLHKFTSKGVYWDIENQRLHHQEETFCKIQKIGTHWALEYNPLSKSELSAPNTANSTPKAPSASNSELPALNSANYTPDSTNSPTTDLKSTADRPSTALTPLKLTSKQPSTALTPLIFSSDSKSTLNQLLTSEPPPASNFELPASPANSTMVPTQSLKLTAFASLTSASLTSASSASVREQFDKREGLHREILPAEQRIHKWRDKDSEEDE